MQWAVNEWVQRDVVNIKPGQIVFLPAKMGRNVFVGARGPHILRGIRRS